MRGLFLRLWRLEGTVDRKTFALGGLAGFALKFALDWSVARVVFDRAWHLINYWHLVEATNRHPGEETLSLPLCLTLAALSIPFIWFGVSMALLRLRDCGWPPYLATFFFLPAVNLAGFIVLCALPPSLRRVERVPKGQAVGSDSVRSAVLAVLVTTTFGVAAAGLSTWLFQTYGVMLFVGLPFCIGFTAAMIHGWNGRRSLMQSFGVAFTALMFVGGAILAVAWEGAICLAMAFPLAVLLAFGGAAIAHLVMSKPTATHPHAAMMFVPMLLPLLMAGEAMKPSAPPLFAVRSSVVINATPERVWRNVVKFSEITEPPEWYFRAGIAYPMRARIEGTGAGAVRYCIFTTGPFVEPITTWDEPRRLAFSVRSQPLPMRELSFYRDVHPPHLDGYLRSERGQFDLERLPGGRTRLTGTTWYRHGLWPARYWALWSDLVIHRIHMRVLRHISKEATAAPRGI